MESSPAKRWKANYDLLRWPTHHRQNHFIEDELQVEAMPTLQVYHDFHKLWERSGTKYAWDLRNTVLRLESNTEEEFLTLGETHDDGIVQDAIEDTMYDYPDNLDTK